MKPFILILLIMAVVIVWVLMHSWFIVKASTVVVACMVMLGIIFVALKAGKMI